MLSLCHISQKMAIPSENERQCFLNATPLAPPESNLSHTFPFLLCHGSYLPFINGHICRIGHIFVQKLKKKRVIATSSRTLHVFSLSASSLQFGPDCTFWAAPGALWEMLAVKVISHMAIINYQRGEDTTKRTWSCTLLPSGASPISRDIFPLNQPPYKNVL